MNHQLRHTLQVFETRRSNRQRKSSEKKREDATEEVDKLIDQEETERELFFQKKELFVTEGIVQLLPEHYDNISPNFNDDEFPPRSDLYSINKDKEQQVLSRNTIDSKADSDLISIFVPHERLFRSIRARLL